MTYSPPAGAGQPPLPHEGQPVTGQPGYPVWTQQGWAQPVPQMPPAAQPHPPLQGYGVPPHPVLPMPYKDSTAAWLLWFFLGAFGAHHFYLGRTGWGVAYAIGFVMSLLLTVVAIGVLGLLALFVLWIVDAAQMSQRLLQHNARAYAVNRSLGFA